MRSYGADRAYLRGTTMINSRLWKILHFCASGLVVILTCYLSLIIYVFGPVLVYRSFSPSPQKECALARQQKMSKKQVIEFFNKRMLPDAEIAIAPSRFEFYRAESRCTVEFDPTSGSVADSAFDKSLAEGTE